MIENKSYRPDELKELNDSWVEEVVFVTIIDKSLDDWIKEIAFH